MAFVRHDRRTQHMRKQLRAEADAQHRLVLLQRDLDREQFGFQVRMEMLLVHVHWTAEHDQALVAVDVRLCVRIALEIVEADAVPAGADARMQSAERFGRDVLEDHQAGHGSKPRSGVRRLQTGAMVSLRPSCDGPVAQRLVQGTHNPLVLGSNPSGPSIPVYLYSAVSGM